jgi:uncharacterized repeat protein (TIGR03803 family)
MKASSQTSTSHGHLRSLALVALFLAGTVAAPAQITAIASFNGTNGKVPICSLTLSTDGTTFYGTTQNGGASGLGGVFSVPVSGGTPTLLCSFSGSSNGANPGGSLTLSGSTLYGTTQDGAAFSLGGVFSVPVSGGTPKLVGNFSGTANGEFPASDLTLIGSTLYGTTESGGANGDGGVFSIPVSGGTPTLLASFSGSANGANPAGSLTLVGSTFYGTTKAGGANGLGGVFSVPVSGGTPTLLASFSGSVNGSVPLGSLTLIGGTLYGTTSSGGANGDGVVFSVPLPEPGSATLLVAGLLAVSMRRRRASLG